MKNSGVDSPDFPRLPGFAFVLQEHFKERNAPPGQGGGWLRKMPDNQTLTLGFVTVTQA